MKLLFVISLLIHLLLSSMLSLMVPGNVAVADAPSAPAPSSSHHERSHAGQQQQMEQERHDKELLHPIGTAAAAVGTATSAS